MKAHLMFPDRDFTEPTAGVADGSSSGTELERDLDLPRLYAAMARDDRFLYDIARHSIREYLTSADDIIYRQEILADFLQTPALVRDLYDLACEALDREHKVYLGFMSKSPDTLLHRSVEVLGIFADMLHRLRELADKHSQQVTSRGLTTLFATLDAELSDPYFAEVAEHLRALRFKTGMTMSARLGDGMVGSDYVLRHTIIRRRTLAEFFHRNSKLSFTLPDRDEAGFRALSELRDRGLNLVADAAARSCDHILSFFAQLRRETGFYVACLNLEESLAAAGCHTTRPAVHAAVDVPALHTTGLYDAALALAKAAPVVSNDLDADRKDLVVVTGANQGGKSTFLRSAGLAFVMMQTGMNVAATTFTASITTGIFTHFKREEDQSMRSGKLDEELARMSDIAGAINPGALLISNESFASTNEREGSEIARQILHALIDSHIRVLFVTHLYDLAGSLVKEHRAGTAFLRAERADDGHRSFHITPGEPFPTSFGRDVYQAIFGSPEQSATPRADLLEAGS